MKLELYIQIISVFVMTAILGDALAEQPGCYTCEVSGVYGGDQPGPFKVRTPEWAPVCVAKGEDAATILDAEIRTSRKEQFDIGFLRNVSVRCFIGESQARVAFLWTEDWVSRNFAETRSKPVLGSQASIQSKTTNNNNVRRKTLQNQTHCLSAVPNAAYGSIALLNNCSKPVEVAFCYLGSGNKTFACTPGRKAGWQQGSITIMPGKKSVMPNSEGGENVLWMGCEAGAIAFISGYDSTSKKPLGGCK